MGVMQGTAVTAEALPGDTKLRYDERAAAEMLAALATCPADQRLDTLAVVVKIAVEDRSGRWGPM